jgi:hypothetical protein
MQAFVRACAADFELTRMTSGMLTPSIVGVAVPDAFPSLHVEAWAEHA